jgi:hypothetical protein
LTLGNDNDLLATRPFKPETIVDENPSPHTVMSPCQKVRVIAFYYPGWGFSDASLPKLRAMLEEIDAPVDVLHSGVTVCFVGEEKKEEFNRVCRLLEAAAAEPEFHGFKVGVAEGYSKSFVDVGRITTEAFLNEKWA